MVVVVGLLAGAVLEARAQDVASPCGSPGVSGGRVARIIDGRSFALDDGREIRLAALEVPSDADAAGQAARVALTALLAGEIIELRAAAHAPDRYGRIVAHAFLNGGSQPAAHQMLALGHARVSAQAGDPACAAELLSRERVARTAKIGLWADPRYAILDGGNLAELVAVQGHFAVVEGNVVSVRERGGMTYVNFGRRWSQALTVTISKRHGRIFEGAGLSPRTLENKRVRVRGWVEVRNGPRIEASRPEQIEVAELTSRP
jgi:endonuclease YncB( thermonuclease family)